MSFVYCTRSVLLWNVSASNTGRRKRAGKRRRPEEHAYCLQLAPEMSIFPTSKKGAKIDISQLGFARDRPVGRAGSNRFFTHISQGHAPRAIKRGKFIKDKNETGLRRQKKNESNKKYRSRTRLKGWIQLARAMRKWLWDGHVWLPVCCEQWDGWLW